MLERYGMETFKPRLAPNAKGDKLSKSQSPKDELERKQMKAYLCFIGWNFDLCSICTRPDITCVVGVFGRF